jgi:catechol 2,3-dioxygenase-like lactoylglutathione lyase family enzyme
MTMTQQAVPTPAAARGRVAPVKFAHIVFRTGQKDAMVEWYRKVLEAEVALANPLLTFLTFDDEHHRIAILGMPGLEPARQPAAGLEHFAFTYGSLGDLLATYRRLREDGILPYWSINHGPNLSFYYRDPDGNQIELQIDVFDTTDAVNRWYATSDFAANPIGVKFDADDLIRRFEAGEPLEALTRRPQIAPDQVFAQLP